jgi:hypothetical protein
MEDLFLACTAGGTGVDDTLELEPMAVVGRGCIVHADPVFLRTDALHFTIFTWVSWSDT